MKCDLLLTFLLDFSSVAREYYSHTLSISWVLSSKTMANEADTESRPCYLAFETLETCWKGWQNSSPNFTMVNSMRTGRNLLPFMWEWSLYADTEFRLYWLCAARQLYVDIRISLRRRRRQYRWKAYGLYPFWDLPEWRLTAILNRVYLSRKWNIKSPLLMLNHPVPKVEFWYLSLEHFWYVCTCHDSIQLLLYTNTS